MSTQARPARHGRRWSTVEQQVLLASVRNKLSWKDVAQILHRSMGACRTRLAQLNQ